MDSCESPNHDATTFKGSSDVLSNFYPCSIPFFGKIFHSSEQAYEYKKALYCNNTSLAEQILAAPQARRTKCLTRQLDPPPSFHRYKLKLMKDIIEAKFEYVPQYAQALQDAKPIIAESVAEDKFWSSGLEKNYILQASIKCWPRLNHMGKIHVYEGWVLWKA